MAKSTEAIIGKYWNAVNDRDWLTFMDLLAEDITYVLPQTREKIQGRLAFKSFNETYPGNWTLSVTTLVSGENQAASIIAFVDNEEEQIGISFFELKDGLIQSITEYWPTPYQPPTRNFEYIERF
ncbi:MAG: nuclear transport factor 2 family protein [Nitrospinales bacterium]